MRSKESASDGTSRVTSSQCVAAIYALLLGTCVDEYIGYDAAVHAELVMIESARATAAGSVPTPMDRRASG
jgi:hypothetical protein